MKKAKFNPAFNPRYRLHINVHLMKYCPYCTHLGEAGDDGYWHHFRCNLTSIEGENCCDYEGDWSECLLNPKVDYPTNYRNAHGFEKRKVA